MSYIIPHIKESKKATKVLDVYAPYPNGDVEQSIAWKFPKSKYQPKGIKYRFAFVHKGKCILRYDNEKAKGHHKHIFDKEVKIKFININILYKKFLKEVKKLRKKLLEETNES